MVETFLDVEFVLVEPETETMALARRPVLPSPVQRWDIEPSDGLTTDGARAMLAGLLGRPLKTCRIISNVGRAYLVIYEPLGKVDPDLVLCAWPSARPVNRAIYELQEARMVDWGSWREFWSGLNRYVEALEAMLRQATITGTERAFVLEWAYGVRDRGRAISGDPWGREYFKNWR